MGDTASEAEMRKTERASTASKVMNARVWKRDRTNTVRNRRAQLRAAGNRKSGELIAILGGTQTLDTRFAGGSPEVTFLQVKLEEKKNETNLKTGGTRSTSKSLTKTGGGEKVGIRPSSRILSAKEKAGLPFDEINKCSGHPQEIISTACPLGETSRASKAKKRERRGEGRD